MAEPDRALRGVDGRAEDDLDDDPVEFEGEYHTIPRSWIGPKPIQEPHPPIYLGAFTPAAAARVGRVADGWITVAYPIAAMSEMFESIRAAAAEAGRDPDGLELLVRANVELFDRPLGDDRMIFTGTLEQVGADVAATREMGATELMFDATFDPGVESVADILSLMEVLHGLGKEAAARARVRVRERWVDARRAPAGARGQQVGNTTPCTRAKTGEPPTA